jgi:hypothetical protein
MTPAEAEAFLKRERSERKPGDEQRYCWLPGDVGFSSDEIIKYEMTSVAQARRATLIVLTTGSALVGFILLIMNLYYRGVVYLVCGPRKGM